jgi:hypothetical protein
MGAIKISEIYKKLATPLPLMADTDTAMSQINHMLYLQKTIIIECQDIMELQSKEANFEVYAQQQTVLNSLFVQHMELGLKATRLITAENLKADEEQAALGASVASTESTEGVQFSARSVEDSAEDGVQLIRRTLSCAEDGVELTECIVGRSLSCEPYVD